MSYNIAIDGPAGAGKSTIAKKVAKELAFIYVDTGAMYRAIALYLLKRNIAKEDREKVEKACENAEVSLKYDKGQQHIWLNGVDVTSLIRTEEVGNMASACAVYSGVRTKLVELQRKLALEQNVVMDGRDIGTAVLPNADLKIYLTASVQTRAKRRFLELKEKGEEQSLQKIEEDIRQRDYRDMTRENSPLKQAADAVFVDSSDMTIEEVVCVIIDKFEQKKQG